MIRRNLLTADMDSARTVGRVRDQRDHSCRSSGDQGPSPPVPGGRAHHRGIDSVPGRRPAEACPEGGRRVFAPANARVWHSTTRRMSPQHSSRATCSRPAAMSSSGYCLGWSVEARSTVERRPRAVCLSTIHVAQAQHGHHGQGVSLPGLRAGRRDRHPTVRAPARPPRRCPASCSFGAAGVVG